MKRVAAKAMACAAVSSAILNPVVAGEAYLSYSQPPARVPDQAYIAQVTEYPPFRPVQRQDAAVRPAIEERPTAAASTEPSLSETITINVGNTVQVVPRSSIQNN